MRIFGAVTVAPYSVALGIALAPLQAQAAGDLVLFPEPHQLAVNIVVFLALIYPVNRLLLRPLVGILEERERRTEGTLARATAVAEQAAAVRREFQGRLEEARRQASEQRLAILAEGERDDALLLEEAQRQAASAIEAVREGIEAQLAEARQGLRADAGELGREAASEILGRSL